MGLFIAIILVIIYAGIETTPFNPLLEKVSKVTFFVITGIGLVIFNFILGLLFFGLVGFYLNIYLNIEEGLLDEKINWEVIFSCSLCMLIYIIGYHRGLEFTALTVILLCIVALVIHRLKLFETLLLASHIVLFCLI